MGEEHLQHYGVKGMKWGVRRTKEQLSKAAKAPGKALGRHLRKRAQKKNARLVKIADKFHAKHKKSPRYQRQYKRNLQAIQKQKRKTKDPHRKAVLTTRQQIVTARLNTALTVAPLLLPTIGPAAATAGRVGAMAARTLAKKAASPSNIIRGKNIIMALKRSPVRYADVSKYKDIINPK